MQTKNSNNINRIFNNKYVLIIIALFITFFAIREGLSEDAHGDFFIFWNAGYNFIHEKALYNQIGGAEEFLYPPFAPMIFGLLSWLPFTIAACLFCLFNLFGSIVLFIISKKIIEIYMVQLKTPQDIQISSFKISITWFWAFIFVVTIRFFWHNFIWCNINVLVTLLSLGGIFLYLRNAFWASIICLVLATSLKVMPGLLLFILACYNLQKTFLKTIIVFAILFLLLLCMRGLGRGIQDFIDFYQIALRPFFNGKVYYDWIALCAPSMLYKLLTAHPNYLYDYHVLNLPIVVVKSISILLQILILAIVLKSPLKYLIKTILNKEKTVFTTIPLQTWCLAYCALVLVAGVSWEGHHVTLIFILPATILMIKAQHIKWKNALLIVSIFIAISGKDIVGAWFYNLSMAWSFITFYMLFILFLLTTKVANINEA